MRAASTFLRHRHHAALLAAAVVALISIAFLETSQVLAQTAGDRAFLAWAVQIEIQQQDMGRIAERTRTDGRSPATRRLPRSTPSAGAAPGGDRGQPTGSGAFEQVVSNASSGSKPLSLDPIGQLRQGLHRPRNRRLSLLPPAFRNGVAYGRAACSAVRHERNCEPQGRPGQNRGSRRRGDLTAPTTEFLLKRRPPQPQRLADHADGGRDWPRRR